MKVKDIVKEGFVSSFARELTPKALRAVLDAGKDKLPPNMYKDAKKAFELFGKGPDYDEERVKEITKGMSPEQAEEVRKKAGAASWLTDFQKMQKQADIDAAIGPEDQYAADTSARARQAASSGFDRAPFQQSQTAQPSKKTAASPSTIASKIRTTAPPPQVKLPSGEYITKYGDTWYNDQGEKIVIPGDIERLERMARGPSGQAGMASTKNIPVQLPGYKGKRK